MTPQSGDEHRKQSAMIGYLATELGLTEPEISPIFRREYDSLSAQAKVKDFLIILVGRRVKESLKTQQKT